MGVAGEEMLCSTFCNRDMCTNVHAVVVQQWHTLELHFWNVLGGCGCVEMCWGHFGSTSQARNKMIYSVGFDPQSHWWLVLWLGSCVDTDPKRWRWWLSFLKGQFVILGMNAAENVSILFIMTWFLEWCDDIDHDGDVIDVDVGDVVSRWKEWR